MATYSKTIGASGADFTSYDAWQSNRLGARGGDPALLSGDIEEAVFLDGVYETGWEVSTSWPAGVTVRVKAQNPHLQDWSVTSQGARLESHGTWGAFKTNGTFNGIAFEVVDCVWAAHASTSNRPAYYALNPQNITVRFIRCLGEGTAASSRAALIDGWQTDLVIHFENTIIRTAHASEDAVFINWSAGNDVALSAAGSYIESLYAGQNGSQTVSLSLEGCLLENIPSPNGTSQTAVDCISPDAFTGWTATNCTVAAFVDADPASGEVGFTDRSTGDYSLRDHANNVAIDYAVNATMPANDLAGETRDASPDCGPLEVVAVGSAPDAPTGFTSGAITHNSLTFSWTDVATDEDNYEVEFQVDGAGSWTVWDAALAADTETDTITGLTAETVYDIRVRATNEFGDSSWLTGQMTTAAASPPPSGVRRAVRRHGMTLALGLLGSWRGSGSTESSSETLYWSQASSWPGGVPEAGDNVLIEEGTTIVLDTDTAALGVLTIEGTLVVQPGAEVSLTADTVKIDGGTLQCGTEASPFTGEFTIELTGATPSFATDGEDGSKLNNGMSRGLMVENGGVLDLHGNVPDVVYTRIGAHIDVSVDDNTIVLSEAVDWPVGAKIILSLTDYYGIGATEELTIAARPDSTTITTVENIATDRWGVMQYFIDASPGISLTPGTFTPEHPDTPTTLDERATVALLTRNIVIQGANDTTWSTDGIGGHTMVDDNACTYRLEGVELRRMGQKHSKGRYPIHFHMLSWVSNLDPDPELRGTWLGEAPAERFYVKGCSVAGSMNRGCVIHGTHGVLVEDNVFFDIKGHAVFEEDGAEEDNIIQRNCVMKVRDPGSGARIKAHDAQASGFWLVNPNNKVRQNIASDCVGRGLWNSFADDPFGLSRDVVVEPRFIVIDEFDDNIGHSCGKSGISTEFPVADEAGNTEITRYLERYTGGQVHIFFARRNQCWKNSDNGYTNRVMAPRYINWTMADNDGSTWGSSDFFGSSLGRAKLQGCVGVNNSLNSATVKDAADYHCMVASYHFEMDFEEIVAIGYELGTPTMWANGQMVQGGGVINTGDLYTDSVFYQMGRSFGWKLIDSSPGLLPRSPLFDGFAVPFGGGNRYWTLGIMHDPYGYWGTAGHHIVPDRDLYTYGLTTSPISGQPDHVGVNAHIYGINRIELDYDSSIGSGGSTHDRMIWHRLDTSNTSIDNHEVGDGDAAIFFDGMRSFIANREGRFLLELPDTDLTVVDHVRINTWFCHVLDEWFLIGLPWDGGRVPTRVSIDTDSTLSTTPTRAISLTGTNIADVLADTSGATGWQDTANDRVWIRCRGTSSGTFDNTAPVTDENNEALAYRRYIQIIA